MPTMDQGASFDRYTLIPRTLIFLTRGERLLLLKGAAQKRLWANQYNGVGGHVERGEDILSAARRELLEETGLSPEELWLCGTVVVDTGRSPGIGIFVLRAECPEGEPAPSAEGTLEWVEVSAAASLPLVEDLYGLLPRVLAMRPGDVPFSARSSYDTGGQLVLAFA